MPIILDESLDLEDHVLPVIEKNTDFIINKGILYHYAYAGMSAPVTEYYIQVQNKYNIPPDELKCFLDDGMSINSIAKHYGCDWSVIKQRIHENPELLETK